MTTIHEVADYIIASTAEAGLPLNLLKLQKLAYYVEAWHEAIHKRPFTGEEFQAWVHGPVNRRLFDRFKAGKGLYSDVGVKDLLEDFSSDSLSENDRLHIDSVLEVYAKYTGTELESMTHQEDPWIVARGNCRPSERCETAIQPALMRSYYAARLA